MKVLEKEGIVIGILATVLLTLFSNFVLKLPREITWITFFVGSIITITVTILKLELNEIINRSAVDLKKVLTTYSRIYDTLNNLQDENLQNQLVSLLNTLKKGEIPAFMAASRTRHLINTANKSCLSIYPIRHKQELYDWIEYPRHRTWLCDNYSAIKRGVKIERTFILRKNDFWRNENWDEKALKVLKEQMENGILIRIIWYEDFERAPTHMSLEQTFSIIDEKEVIHDEGKGNNRLYRIPSVKVEEFNDIWNEHLKYSIIFSVDTSNREIIKYDA